MANYIDKSNLISEIDRKIKETEEHWKSPYGIETATGRGILMGYRDILSFINTLEVIDPYEQCIQYSSVKDGIEAHASTYSFNIESELFNQLTPEQQKIWRREIEQAVISGGEIGVELARDARYKENLNVKEMDLDYIKKELDELIRIHKPNGDFGWGTLYNVVTHFFELGLQSKNEGKIVAEEEGTCNKILNRIVGKNWNLICPISKMNVNNGEKVKIIIIKED